MNRIDLRAVVLAFAAEFALDMLIGRILLMIFGSGLLEPEMSRGRSALKVIETITRTGHYQLTGFSAAAWPRRSSAAISRARLAKGFPYYNGPRHR